MEDYSQEKESISGNTKSGVVYKGLKGTFTQWKDKAHRAQVATAEIQFRYL